MVMNTQSLPDLLDALIITLSMLVEVIETPDHFADDDERQAIVTFAKTLKRRSIAAVNEAHEDDYKACQICGGDGIITDPKWLKYRLKGDVPEYLTCECVRRPRR